MRLWSLRYSPAWSWHWRIEREVSAETASEWLRAFQLDQPRVEFRIADRRPKAPRCLERPLI